MAGTNEDIGAPVVAFVAYKLAQNLASDQWKTPNAKVDDGDKTEYAKFLRLAVTHRNQVITARHETDADQDTWITIAYVPEVSFSFAALPNPSMLVVLLI